MQKYLDTYKQMISLRGLTDHTIKSYCTYLNAYLNYLNDVLHKMPEDVSWEELRGFILWLQQQRDLSDRTINHCISQLRFFTLYVLHKPWDNYQLPFRKFDSYLPFVPTKDEVRTFISTIPDLKQKAMVALMYSAGLRIGEVCHLKYQDIERKKMRIHITHGKNRSDFSASFFPWPHSWLHPAKTRKCGSVGSRGAHQKMAWLACRPISCRPWRQAGRHHGSG